MAKEGKNACIVIFRDRLQELNSALSYADYERRREISIKKDNEIGTWKKEIKNNRAVHVQVVDEGRFLKLFSHTEPSLDSDLIGHGISVLDGTANFGAGCIKLRTDLRKTGFRFR